MTGSQAYVCFSEKYSNKIMFFLIFFRTLLLEPQCEHFSKNFRDFPPLKLPYREGLVCFVPLAGLFSEVDFSTSQPFLR